MTGERSTLNMGDLDDFAPRSKGAGNTPSPAEVRKAVDSVATFPSREASPDAQLNIHGPAHVIERFKALCKDDRRSYHAMLEILMDKAERQ